MTALVIFLVILATLFLLFEIYSRNCLKNLEVAINFSAKAATEGDRLFLTEELSNKKWLPLPLLALRFKVGRELEFHDQAIPVLDYVARNDLFYILMHQKVTRRIAFTCTRRGFYRLYDLELNCWDILMHGRYRQKFEADTRITVYPKTLPKHEADELCTRIYGQIRTRYPIYTDPFSFRGIREYAYGDPMKNINFKASAKTAELMVNIRDFGSTRQVVLLLDMERHILRYNDALDERAIQIVATLAEHLTSAGVPVSFITNGMSILSGESARIAEGKGSSQLHTILEVLAYIDINAKGIEPFAAVLHELADLGDTEPEYWFISPYWHKSLEEGLLILRSIGARTVWAMPSPRYVDLHYSDMAVFI